MTAYLRFIGGRLHGVRNAVKNGLRTTGKASRFAGLPGVILQPPVRALVQQENSGMT